MKIMNVYYVFENLLVGKIIFIIGVGDGIGVEVVWCYVKYGVICILLGRIVSKLEKVYDDIVVVGGSELVIVLLDLKGVIVFYY